MLKSLASRRFAAAASVAAAMLSVILFMSLCAPAQAGSIKLTWSSPGDDVVLDTLGQPIGATGTPAGYIAYYSLEPFDSLTFSLADTLRLCPGDELPAGSPQVCVLSGLLADSVYHVMLRAFDDAGNVGGPGNVVQAVAEDDISPAAILTLEVLPL